MAGIFIVGCQRSGTTALYRALSAHPNLEQQSDNGARPSGTKKELWFFQEFFRGREANPHRPHCPSDIDTEYQRRFARFIDDFCTEKYSKGSNRWISAHPRDGLYIDQILPLFSKQDLRVIFLVRHPQEVVWSAICAPWAKQNPSTEEMLAAAAEGTKYWSRFGPNAVAARDGSLGDNVKLVYHRNLLEDPEGTIRDVLNHIGEPFDERVVLEISRTSNSSFDDQTSHIKDLTLRSTEISSQKQFCSVVTHYASPYMQDLGFHDYNSEADHGWFYKSFPRYVAAAERVKNALKGR